MSGKAKVFTDGSAGTTGLKIVSRLRERDDVELITLSDDKRKDTEERRKAINAADIAFLCLPDDAAREAVSMSDGSTVIIDTSTAHRTEERFAYGFAELSEKHRDKIKNSKYIAVPGCHASGFIALIYPLCESGVIKKDINLSCFSLTGYSGGGKKMIAEYESDDRSAFLSSPRQYGISQTHKHLKEMVKISGIEKAPVFCPTVADFYSGMEVTVPLFKSDVSVGIEEIKKIYSEKYNTDIVFYLEDNENGFLASNKMSGKDSMQIAVYGNDERMILTARYDNLGKGASGAAVECMNIALGADDKKGLVL